MSYEQLVLIPPNTNLNGANVSTTLAPQIPVNPNAIPIVAPNGLVYPENTNLSNGLSSRLVAGAAGINDFNIINPYIHYANTTSIIQFDPTSFLELATERFNIYSSQYRNAR